MTIEPITSLSDPRWMRMRLALWPDTSEAEHITEMNALLAEPDRFAQFLAIGPSGEAVGLAEASLRSDHVIGAETSPVGYLEGLYVEPGARQQGVARSLVVAVASWAKAKNCAELVSDTPLENEVSQATHIALGFTETERIVFYRLSLNNPNAA